MSAGQWPKLIALVLGCILLALMARGLRHGAVRVLNRSIRRKDEPALYWAGILIAAVGGAALVAFAVVPQLQRL